MSRNLRYTFLKCGSSELEETAIVKINIEFHVLRRWDTPTGTNKSAAPIVPVIKSDGSIRICGDYKVPVNQAAKVH